MILYFASGNSHKIEEIRSMLPVSIELKSLADIGIDIDLPETGVTLKENAIQKARYLADRGFSPVFADDTGLEVNSLDGAPGVYSARYAGPQRNPKDNIELLLNNMRGISSRKARFVTYICLIINKKEHIFEGMVHGKILEVPTGEQGFGYDPVFVPEAENKSFAEMSIEEKNKYSHRARALEKLMDYLVETPV